jgi:acetyltransferase-like isoleucine patch superfamily enzyme
VNGNVSIGDGTFVGSGSVILQGVIIGENCFIQAGSIIQKNLPSGAIVKYGKA